MERGPAAAVVLAAVVLAAALLATALLPADPAAARNTAPGPGIGSGIGTVHTVSLAAQAAAGAYWTPGRMAAASAARLKDQKGTRANPPPGTPTATPFAGVPTIGTLFYTTGSAAHFCTASVVDSEHENLVMTAAHCVYASGYSTNIEFVPGYHDGRRPYGAWLIQAVVVASGWRQRHDPDLDFAFLTVAPSGTSGRPLQGVTGGLRLGTGLGYAHPIRVIGYNDAGPGSKDPVRCATDSFRFRAGQMEFYCHGYRDGTSGGPWVIGYTSRGTGTLFGVIGGYQEGGVYEWASYSPVFGAVTLGLFRQAEATA